jgi:NAD(P)-dependent dehydrogenase (short-subunit alcohol dehydrogenase family)
MRKQKSGHILQISSALGLATAPTLGMYNASKWAVEGLSETLATEVKDFGIKVTIVEPNGFETEWGGASASWATPIKEYDPIKEAARAAMTGDLFGVPDATVDAIFTVVDAPQPPLRLFLGKVGFPWVKQVYEDRLATWEKWQPVSVAAHGK